MAPARVRSVDRAHDLVDLEVDWTKFVVVERPQPGTTFSRAQTPAFAWVKWQKNFSEPRTLNYYLRSNG